MQDHNKIKEIIKSLLEEIGEDPKREGLVKTPERVAKSWEYFISGYKFLPEDVINDAIFEEECDEIIVIKNIDFFSLCEHHLLPFKGVAHIGYLPNKKIIGLSKIPRIVDMYARRLQVQERMTNQIAGALQKTLKPTKN